MPYSSEAGAFLAGLLLGEGSIIFSESKRPYTQGRNGKKYPAHRKYMYCHVTIVNTEMEILEKAQFMAGTGNIRYNRGRCFMWSITNRKDIVEFLEAVFPYLVGIKKRKAEVLLEYCRSRQKSGYFYTPYERGLLGLFRGLSSVPV